MRVASQAGYFALIVALTSLLGFVREIIIARHFGLSSQMDCFISAFAIVSFVAAIFSPQTFQPMFMPAYRDALQKNKIEASILSNNMALLLSLIMLIIAGTLYMLAPYIVRIVLPGFSSEKLHLTSQLVRMMCPIVATSGLISLTHAICNSHQQFHYPVCTQTINNLLVISLLILIPIQSVNSLATYYIYGNLLGFCLLVFAYFHFTSSPQINLRHRHYLDNISLTWPLFIVAFIDQSAIFLPRSFASTLAHGDITALGYAYRLTTLSVSILAAAIISVLFPRIIAHVRDLPERALATIRVVSNLLLYCLLPVAIFTFSESRAIVSVLFSSRQFNESAVNHTASALSFYSLGILGLGYNLFLNRVYAAYGAYWAYVKLSILAFIGLFGLISVCIELLQYRGIALAFSLASCMLSAALYLNLRRFGLKRVISYHSLLNLAISSLLTLLLLIYLPDTSLLLLGMKAALYLASFYAILWMLRDAALQNIVKELKNK